jgi:proline dehydrogenase
MRTAGAAARLRAALAESVVPRLARRYVAGPDLSHALVVCRQESAAGRGSALGYWAPESPDPPSVLAAYEAAVTAVAAEGLPTYVSLKLPDLGVDPARLHALAGLAEERGVRLHLDSVGLEGAEPMMQAVTRRPGWLGATLPGRWARSLQDARTLAPLDVPVRVVKGQFPDPGRPGADLRAGFLGVVDVLAGRRAPVAVATHDHGLAATALGRLRAAGTPVRLEQLYGLRPLAPYPPGLDVVTYVPYGTAYLPYALRQLRERPGLLLAATDRRAARRRSSAP